MAQAGAPSKSAESLIQGQAMSATQIYDAKFLTILWNEKTRTIGIDWKETTAAMKDEDFKADLTHFAGEVERRGARGILVDVSRFRHKMDPEVQQWRIKDISSRYNAAGVERFAFLFPEGAQVPPMMNQSSPGEKFTTRAFTNLDQAENWLSEIGGQSAAD